MKTFRYFGWRSGEPEGPYWGKLGRSEGWETTRQGLMNLKLENQYLSLLPLLLAAAAVGFAATGRRRSDTIFWSVAAVIALLLSFGKFGLLYQLAYRLPLISYVRAPVKFLQVFQVALAILAAMGLDAYLRAQKDGDAAPRALKWIFTGVTVLLGLAWLGARFAASAKLQGFVEFGWPEYLRRNLKCRPAPCLIRKDGGRADLLMS